MKFFRCPDETKTLPEGQVIVKLSIVALYPQKDHAEGKAHFALNRAGSLQFECNSSENEKRFAVEKFFQRPNANQICESQGLNIARSHCVRLRKRVMRLLVWWLARLRNQRRWARRKARMTSRQKIRPAR